MLKLSSRLAARPYPAKRSSKQNTFVSSDLVRNVCSILLSFRCTPFHVTNCTSMNCVRTRCWILLNVSTTTPSWATSTLPTSTLINRIALERAGGRTWSASSRTSFATWGRCGVHNPLQRSEASIGILVPTSLQRFLVAKSYKSIPTQASSDQRFGFGAQHGIRAPPIKTSTNQHNRMVEPPPMILPVQ